VQKLSKKSKNIIGLLGIHVSFFTLDVFISIFLIARIYELTNNNIASVALFNLILFATLFITFCIFMYIVRKFSKIWNLRLAVLVNIILVSLIILLNDNLIDYYLLLGLLNGIAMGMYWASMHTLTGEVIEKDYVRTYMIYAQIAYTCARIIFPITLGLLIHYIDFIISAWFTLIAAIIVIFFTFFLSENENAKKPLSIKNFFKTIKNNNLTKQFKHNFLIQFMYGIYSIFISLSMTILIVNAFDDKASLNLGLFNSIFAGASIVLLTIYQLLKKHKNKIFYASIILPLILTIFLFIQKDYNNLSVTSVLLFISAYSILSGIVRSESDSLRINITKLLEHDEITNENILITEVAYFLARTVSLPIFIILYLINLNIIFIITIYLMLIILLISGILLKKWYRKYHNSY